MALEDPAPKATRRRGAELENAILEAVWDQLSEQGYAGLTYEAVAARARTSRAVLYRRWPTRETLVRAAVRHLGARTPRISPDTGSLREDVLAILRHSNETRLGMSGHSFGGLTTFVVQPLACTIGSRGDGAAARCAADDLYAEMVDRHGDRPSTI